MNATHIVHECTTRRQLANRVLKALNELTETDNGTIRNPFEAASIRLHDGRTLIEALYEDGELMYNDGYLIVEADDYCVYVDYTMRAINEWGFADYECKSNID